MQGFMLKCSHPFRFDAQQLAVNKISGNKKAAPKGDGLSFFNSFQSY
jgi:hypothetical protein